MRTPIVLRVACTLALLLLAVAVPAGAQTASLVRDINTGEQGLSGTFFNRLTAVQGKLYFTTPNGGRFGEDSELWVSDGTAEGTRMLLDDCAEDCESEMSIYGGLGNLLFFTSGPTDLSRLWRSDGTRTGTFRLHPDLFVPPYNFVPPFAFFRGALYFVGCSQIFFGDCDLWRTDGSTAGTVRIKDFDRSSFSPLVAGKKLFLSVRDQERLNSSLWATDGTTAGTVLVKAFGPKSFSTTILGDRLFLHVSAEGEPAELWTSDGTPSGTRMVSLSGAQPGRLFPIGGRIYFLGTDPIYGTEVWTTDGTAAGTRRLTGFGPDDPRVRDIAGAGDRAVFIANDGLHGDQIWTTRGTLGSTAALPSPCADCSFVSDGTRLVKTADRLVFLADDGSHGWEPWVTDGTAQGTRLLADLCPGACDSVNLWDTPLLPTSQGVLFEASDAVHGHELWRTDGTTAGTVRLSDLGGSSRPVVDTSSSPPELEAAAVGPNVFFAVTDGTGAALWKSAGPGASQGVALIDPQGPSSGPDELIAFGDQLLFRARDRDGSHLWSSRGSSESTIPLGFVEDSDPLTPIPAGGLVFFRSEDRGNSSLWRTDGTPAGTVQLVAGGVEPVMTAWQGQVFFLTSSNQIWKSDGTPQGTQKVLEIPWEDGQVVHIAGLGSDLYFSTGFLGHRQFWRSDGTQAGTRELTDMVAVHYLASPELVRIGSLVFFRDGDRVWKTDGTREGTAVVSGGGSAIEVAPTHLTAYQGALYFFARTSSGQRGLWRSDGTAAGTVLIRELHILYPDEIPETYLTAAGGRLWFVANDGVHGTELWTSDGTAAGTLIVRDILAGPESSAPSGLTFAGGRLFFAANDRVHGIELWQSNGTEAGTRLVQDLAPMAASSFPQHLTVVGDRLYFSANDGPAGRELWVLPLSVPGGCQPSATALCLGNGRFRVEVHWRDFQGNSGPGTAVSLTPDTGYFWFFDPSNIELILKVLDGRSLNGHHWVFYGALSNVEYAITVTDTETGLTRQYVNPPGKLASVGDTRGFGPLGAYSRTGPPAAAPPPLVSERSAEATGSCQPSATRLCLRDGRFAVEASWKDFQGKTGKGTAVNLTGDTGYFWFFDAANVEVVLKVLDGTPINGKQWVFYGALSNVEYMLTVTDTQTGKVKTYKNTSGRFASVADTAAF